MVRRMAKDRRSGRKKSDRRGKPVRKQRKIISEEANKEEEDKEVVVLKDDDKESKEEDESSSDSDDPTSGEVMHGIELIGEPIAVEGKRVYYKALKSKSGETYHVGQFAYLDSGEIIDDYIALIDRVFTAPSQKNRKCFVRCRWFFQSGDAQGQDGSVYQLARNEVMASDVTNTNEARFLVDNEPLIISYLPTKILPSTLPKSSVDRLGCRYVLFRASLTRVRISHVPDSLHPLYGYDVSRNDEVANLLNQEVFKFSMKHTEDILPFGNPSEEDDENDGKSDEETEKDELQRVLTAFRKENKENPKKEPLTRVTAENAYKHALDQLQLGTIPHSLPCRDVERKEVLHFLASHLESGEIGGCLYISGMPGTGKTATVNEALNHLRDDALEKGEVPPFQVLYVNGMDDTVTGDIEGHIYRELYRVWSVSERKQRTATQSLKLLRSRMGKPSARRISVILFIDEVDQLITRSTSCIYNLTEWACTPNSQLLVVGLANTMDLPERVLSSRVNSRFGMNRIQFAPYSVDQLMTIILSRLTENECSRVFKEDAVEFIARKISAVSGDCRRALHLCSRSVEIARSQWKDISRGEIVPVSVKNVDSALAEVFATSRELGENIRSLPRLHKSILAQTCNLTTGTGASETIEMYSLADRACNILKITQPKFTVYHVMEGVNQLCAQGYLLVTPNEGVVLTIDPEEVRVALGGEDDKACVCIHRSRRKT